MASYKGLKISSLLTLPADAVTSTMVVYGGKGMGKTNFGGVLVEELSSSRLKWAVLDPMGVWWGIRHSVDGKGDGVPCLILGGAHGDIPIEPTGGAVVADLVADELVSVVIDISRKANGEMWSISERIRFMHDYGKQLFRRQGSLVNGRRREPMMQVIDEAARFIPQMIRSGQPELAMCTSVWSTIVEEGRNVGLGVTLLTQRSARLNKDVAELADVMLAFRTVGPNSLAAVTDWLSAQVSKDELKSMSEKVRSLPVGSCLVVSPGWLKVEKIVPIRRRETFDSSATPKPGEQAARVRGNGAKPDLAKYSERMKETIERAKEDSVPELKRRIRDLEGKVAKMPAAASVGTRVAENSGTQELKKLKEENVGLKRGIRDRQVRAEKFLAAIDKTAQAFFAVLTKSLDEFRSDAPLPVEAPALGAPERPISARPFVDSKPVPAVAKSHDGKLTGLALKIAAVAAGYGQRGEGVERQLLATLLGVSASGGGFGARLSEARTAGAIITEGGMVRATQLGIEQYSGSFHAPSTTREVVELWSSKLTGKAREMFLFLVEQGGASVSRAELATAVGMSAEGGGFGARLSEVRSTRLLVEGGGKVGVNRELLFM